jgi:AmmeMemoRadiSam system protein B
MAHSAANRLAPPDVVSDPVPVPPDLPESPSARIDKMTHSTSTLRPAAVAGTFYPGTAGVLTRDLRRLLSDALPGQGSHEQRRPKAIIVPHAGYVYSGAIAATVYAPLHALRASIRRVVLLGPTHRVAVAGLAVPSVSAFATPLGEVPLDSEAMRSIARLPQVVVSDAAHAREHSLEVQLPFLQAVLEQFTLVPLAVGDASPSEVAEVLETLWGGDETLIVISSDLSHFLPYARACETDSDTARHIVALDAKLNHQQACGATPVNGLLLAARRHGLRARLLDLRNSGDTAGDKVTRRRLWRLQLYAGERRCPLGPLGSALLISARNAIAAKFGLPPQPVTPLPELTAPGASFVTLTQNGQLRGCIGSLEARAAAGQRRRRERLRRRFSRPALRAAERAGIAAHARRSVIADAGRSPSRYAVKKTPWPACDRESTA